ncbi:unnamed protein product [Rotaria magnacalcarata]|uniref:Uncharacterized protein n=1 Tax=Rotaria magnacalcarata TaxID=392030 RepID=A0A816RAD6_9BILA|nr:unnamed protein product [Rotaria magnacalcarata]CAF4117968.1 unnamed protein product [Rotaria magnacalcarata]
MATTRQQKNLCTICGDMAGTFLCRGCQQNFCLNHTHDHRDQLQQRMNDINNRCHRLKDNIQGQNVPGHRSSLLEDVDSWERRSTEKVRRLADDIRQQVSNLAVDNASDLKEKIEELQEELNTANEKGGFYEDDLEEWLRRLRELQNLVPQRQKLKVEETADPSSFISPISLKPIPMDSVQGTNFPDSPITAKNKIPGNNATTVPYPEYPNWNNKPQYNGSSEDPYQYDTPKKYGDHSEDHNKDRYSSGRHTLRFKVDQFKPNTSIVFGVVSKNQSTDTPIRENPTFYGWADNNAVYLGGDLKYNHNGYKSDFKSGDMYQLLIDCDQEKLRLKNERTDISYELEVDTTKCSIPWQPNVRMTVHNQ